MIKIVTDSASDLSKDDVLKHDIDILPVLLTFNDKTIREFYDITNEDYYDILLKSEEVPKTAQITLDSLLNCFEIAKNNGYKKLLYITINSAGSGTYNTALIARDMFYEESGKDLQIEILDSRGYSYLYGHVAIECAKMRDEGKSFEEILAYATEELPKMRAVIGVCDLKQLKKSGRISGASAFVGDALGLKPIIKVGDYVTEVCAKARGNANLVKKIVELTLEECNSFEKAYLVTGIAEENVVLSLETELLKHFKEVKNVKLGASITTNTGANIFGVVYHI